MYDFLNNFHKRMEKLSYTFLIDQKASTLNMFNDYFDEFALINITYSLMCYVLDKSLKDEECTIHDMSLFLYDLIKSYYNQQITEDDAYKITRYIVYKILRNDGKEFTFETTNYSTGEKVSYSYHLLQQKPSKVDVNKSTFYLEQQGYRLILGALEVDEKTQIDINQMILELSLKKKNFAQGLMAVENLNNLITAQINIINNFIYKARENIFTIDHEEFETNFIKNLEVLKEQNKKFDELQEIIIFEENRLRNLDDLVSQETYDSLIQLGKIKGLLKRITDKASNLISKHFEFKVEYKKALEEATLYLNHSHISIKEDIITPIEADATKLGELYRLFNPLFRFTIPKKFNVNVMFNEQQLYSHDEDETSVQIENIEVEDIERLAKSKAREEYKNIVVTLLEFIVNRRNTTLKELMNHYETLSDESYNRLVPKVRKLSEVLIELLRIGQIDVKKMMKEQQDAYTNDEIIFDLRKFLVDEINAHYKLVGINFITFYKDDREKVEVKERKTEEPFVTIEVLTCPNIIIEMK